MRLVDGKYQIVQLMPGRGALMRMRAVNPTIGRDVELWAIGPRTTDPLASELADRESRAHGVAPHRHIQGILDCGTDQGRPYFVLEAVDGPTVAEVIAAEGRLERERAARLTLQLLDAMKALHAARVVVRCLTPDGVVLTPTPHGEVLKLCRLDRAEFVDEPESRAPMPFSPYLAPEIRRGDAGRDVRSDLYAAGAMFRHMITGKPTRATVDDPLASRAIDRATAEDLDERFPTAEVCMQAVSLCADEDERVGVLPDDPLVRDLHYLMRRKRTRHATLAEDSGRTVVELSFSLLVIEAVYRRVGPTVWRRIADDVPAVERLLPAAGEVATFERDGVPLRLIEQVLESADRLAGKDDMGFLADIANEMLSRGASRVFPQLPPAAGPDSIVDGISYLWRRVLRAGDAQVHARDDQSAKVVLHAPAGSLEVTGLFGAVVRATLRRSAPAAEVSVLAAQALGDGHDTLILRW